MKTGIPTETTLSYFFYTKKPQIMWPLAQLLIGEAGTSRQIVHSRTSSNCWCAKPCAIFCKNMMYGNLIIMRSGSIRTLTCTNNWARLVMTCFKWYHSREVVIRSGPQHIKLCRHLAASSIRDMNLYVLHGMIV